MECLTHAVQSCGVGVSSALFTNLLGTLLTAQCALSPKYQADISTSHSDVYDFIIVGAGSSGSALAAKLAKDSDYQILLIEAGGNPPQSSDIPALYFSMQKTSYDWGYKTVPQKHACRAMENEKCNQPRGKMMGGSSSINAMMYVRGLESDYDEWEELGNKGWGWNSVKPYFENQYTRLELEEYDINQIKNNSYSVVKDVLFAAAEELEIPIITNRKEKLHSTIGYFKTLATIKHGTRNNAARQFLGEVTYKNNLHILKNAHVSRVMINSVRKVAEGVEVWVDEQWKIIRTNKEIILSAGAFNTPQILMLSGIGPEDDLKSLGISVLENLPVGKNLQDHQVTYGIYHGLHKSSAEEEQIQDRLDKLYYYLTQRKGPLRTIGITDMTAFFNSSNLNSPIPDVQAIHFFYSYKNKESLSSLINITNFNTKLTDSLFELNSLHDILIQTAVLLKPKSRGTVKLRNVDSFESPIIDPNYFEDPADVEVTLKALKHFIKMGETNVMKKHEAERLEVDIPECNKHSINSDEYLKCIIYHTTSTLYHPVGTAKMGVDESAVVGYDLKVKGIKGLRVADASIMPTIVSANTNAACMMIGEKAGDIVLEEWMKNKKRDEL